MQIGPGENVGCWFGVLLGHSPGGQDRFDLRAMGCVRCGHNGLLQSSAQPCAVVAFRQGCSCQEVYSMNGAELLRARFGIDLPGVEVPPEITPLLDRRVTRRYTDQPVPDSLLDALLA